MSSNDELGRLDWLALPFFVLIWFLSIDGLTASYKSTSAKSAAAAAAAASRDSGKALGYMPTPLVTASSSSSVMSYYDRYRASRSGLLMVLAPPPVVFGVVWTILYGLIGLAGFEYWRLKHGSTGAQLPSHYSTVLTLYFINYVFNKSWSWLFFGRHKARAALFRRLALLDLLAALCSAIAIVVYFGRDSHHAAAPTWSGASLVGLYLPYVIWLAYAALLNASTIAYDMGRSEVDRRAVGE